MMVQREIKFPLPFNVIEQCWQTYILPEFYPVIVREID